MQCTVSERIELQGENRGRARYMTHIPQKEPLSYGNDIRRGKREEAIECSLCRNFRTHEQYESEHQQHRRVLDRSDTQRRSHLSCMCEQGGRMTALAHTVIVARCGNCDMERYARNHDGRDSACHVLHERRMVLAAHSVTVPRCRPYGICEKTQKSA